MEPLGSCVQTARLEIEARESQIRRIAKQKHDAEEGLIHMRQIFEDMKRIEHMKRGVQLLK